MNLGTCCNTLIYARIQALGNFLNALSRGKHRGEFGSILPGSWQQPSSGEHGGVAPGSVAGQRQTWTGSLASAVIDVVHV